MDTLPYSYRGGHSALHALPALPKLIALFVLSLNPFFFGIWAVLPSAAIVLAGAAAARLNPRSLLRGVKPLVIMMITITVFRSISLAGFDRAGFTEAVSLALTVLVSFSAGALLFAVTTMTELKNALSSAEKIMLKPAVFVLKHSKTEKLQTLATRLETPRIGLLLALMLMFIPRFFEVWDNADTAYLARAGKKGIARIAVLVPLVTERMLETAAETAAALEARGGI